MKPLGKTVKTFTAEIACSKTSIVSQTDSVDEMNWLTSKLHSSISLILKLSFLQIDSNYEMN